MLGLETKQEAKRKGTVLDEGQDCRVLGAFRSGDGTS